MHEIRHKPVTGWPDVLALFMLKKSSQFLQVFIEAQRIED
jgi:hypothetical protein